MIHRLDGLTQQKFTFSQMWSLQVQDKMLTWLVSGNISLLANGHILAVSLCGLFSVCIEAERSLVLLSHLVRILVLFNYGSTFVTLFDLNYLFKGPISKYSHVGGQEFNVGILKKHNSINNRDDTKKYFTINRSWQ